MLVNAFFLEVWVQLAGNGELATVIWTVGIIAGLCNKIRTGDSWFSERVYPFLFTIYLAESLRAHPTGFPKVLHKVF